MSELLSAFPACLTELYFLIARFLSQGPCQNASEVITIILSILIVLDPLNLTCLFVLIIWSQMLQREMEIHAVSAQHTLPLPMFSHTDKCASFSIH